MHHFAYTNGTLHAEGVSLIEIAQKVGTPTYVYSQATLARHFKVFVEALAGLDALVCFSVKSNTNRALMALFASLGGGTDIVSGGELTRSLAAGVAPEKIVFSGVGKTRAEMAQALKAGILMFNVESEQELTLLNQVAGEMGLKAPVGIRVNPDVDAKTHPKITTGLLSNKFGLPIDAALAQYRRAAGMANVTIKGVSCHIGSQLTEATPFADTVERLADLVSQLKSDGIAVEYLDLGGGLGITYHQEEPPDPAHYAKAINDTVSGLGLRLIVEPGRVLAGNAGILLAQVLYTKTTSQKHFLVVDAAMNDLIRPSFYGSFHGIWPVEQKADRELKTADVVGPICESGDFLAKDRELPDFKPGELMAVMSAGAYGFTMSSNYNSRPRAAEVMVNGDRWAVVRARETAEDLMRGESLPPWMP